MEVFNYGVSTTKKEHSIVLIALVMFIVSNAAFPWKIYVMKQYPGTNVSFEEKIYNYRLSQARCIVENIFGIWINRF